MPELRGQLHHMRRAFDALELSGILCIDARPTVYFRDYSAPLTRSDVNTIQRRTWNQGVATLLVLRDPQRVYVFSAMAPPSNDDEPEVAKHRAFIEPLEPAAEVLRTGQFVENLISGHYYRQHRVFFDASKTVDRYLIDNLGILCCELEKKVGRPNIRAVHAFVGRLLFLCYLVDRDVIRLQDYRFIANKQSRRVVDLLLDPKNDDIAALFVDELFPALRKEFNGSLFDVDTEKDAVLLGKDEIDLLVRFLKGEQITSPQMTLNFWGYDFSMIPVETLSAIYEKFLEREDAGDKKVKGAFYTPKNLAEMVVEEALAETQSILDKKFLDPACGSGVFLVSIFNRLAEEWRQRNPQASVAEKFQGLLHLLQHNVKGVDIHETACRITCFSLYVAFLDQFDPPTLRALKEEVSQQQRKPLLPPLLCTRSNRAKNAEASVVFEGDFFERTLPIGNDFHFIIGNPPWVSRKGSTRTLEAWISREHGYEFAGASSPKSLEEILAPGQQVAFPFAWKAPLHNQDGGISCFVLPSAMLLNKTDSFQREFFARFQVERIAHLADYRRFLFDNAIRPCFIIKYKKSLPNAKESIEYFTPKVMHLDPRTGSIPALAEDRKWIRVDDIIAAARDKRAAILWKSHLWGTSRDLKLIRLLCGFAKLGELAGEPGSDKPFKKGKGFQPWYPIAHDDAPEKYGEPKSLPVSLSHACVRKLNEDMALVGVPDDTRTLRNVLETEGYSKDRQRQRTIHPDDLKASTKGLRRSPDRILFQGPQVLISKGFGYATFFEDGVIFKDPITGISGAKQDAETLMFLTAYVRSKLGFYFIFHTAGALGTEREEVHVEELLELPFPLPGREEVAADAHDIVKQVADLMRDAKREIELLYKKSRKRTGLPLFDGNTEDKRRQITEKLQGSLEKLVYQYFELTDEEIALVEDTYSIYAPSATPAKPDTALKTLEEATSKHLLEFATQLCTTLNRWVQSKRDRRRPAPFVFNAEFTSLPRTGLAMVTLSRGAKESAPKEKPSDASTERALAGMANASREARGAFEYVRGFVYATPEAIHIVKPALRGQWTSTAALNAADGIYEAIVMAGDRSSP